MTMLASRSAPPPEWSNPINPSPERNIEVGGPGAETFIRHPNRGGGRGDQPPHPRLIRSQLDLDRDSYEAKKLMPNDYLLNNQQQQERQQQQPQGRLLAPKLFSPLQYEMNQGGGGRGGGWGGGGGATDTSSRLHGADERLNARLQSLVGSGGTGPQRTVSGGSGGEGFEQGGGNEKSWMGYSRGDLDGEEMIGGSGDDKRLEGRRSERRERDRESDGTRKEQGRKGEEGVDESDSERRRRSRRLLAPPPSRHDYKKEEGEGGESRNKNKDEEEHEQGEEEEEYVNCKSLSFLFGFLFYNLYYITKKQ